MDQLELVDQDSIEFHLLKLSNKSRKKQIDDEIAREQVAFADTVIVNKIDLVDEPQRIAIEAKVRSLNPSAVLLNTTRSRLAVAQKPEIQGPIEKRQNLI